jgi:hypothetical protein
MLEHLFHGLMQVTHGVAQGFRVGAVAAAAVGGHRAGRGRVRDQDARRGFDGCKTVAAEGAVVVNEWIIAAGVQNHDVEAIARIAHLFDDPIRAHCLDFHITLALDLRGRGNQIVLAVQLHTMARVVEKTHRRGTGFLEARAEFLDRTLHRGLVCVGARNDFESQLLERLADQARIVGGVGQRASGVAAVADHQCDPGLGRHGRRRPQADQSHKSETDAVHARQYRC